MHYDKWGICILSREERLAERQMEYAFPKMALAIIAIACILSFVFGLNSGKDFGMQGDNLNNKCTKEYVKQYEQAKEYPFWCPYMFSGMPSTLISNPMFSYGTVYDKVIYPISAMILLCLPLLLIKSFRRRVKIWYYLKIKRKFREDEWTVWVGVFLISEALAGMGYAVYLLLTWKF